MKIFAIALIALCCLSYVPAAEAGGRGFAFRGGVGRGVGNGFRGGFRGVGVVGRIGGIGRLPIARPLPIVPVRVEGFRGGFFGVRGLPVNRGFLFNRGIGSLGVNGLGIGYGRGLAYGGLGLGYGGTGLGLSYGSSYLGSGYVGISSLPVPATLGYAGAAPVEHVETRTVTYGGATGAYGAEYGASALTLAQQLAALGQQITVIETRTTTSYSGGYSGMSGFGGY